MALVEVNSNYFTIYLDSAWSSGLLIHVPQIWEISFTFYLLGLDHNIPSSMLSLSSYYQQNWLADLVHVDSGTMSAGLSAGSVLCQYTLSFHSPDTRYPSLLISHLLTVSKGELLFLQPPFLPRYIITLTFPSHFPSLVSF